MTRLADLRDRIRRGTYRVDPVIVADALLLRAGEDWITSPAGRWPQIGCS